MNKTISAAIALFTLIGMLFAADAYYLHRADFEAFAQGYAADKSEAKIDALTQRQWKIEDRIEVLKDDGPRNNGPAIRALEEQKKDIADQIEREKTKLKSIYDKQ